MYRRYDAEFEDLLADELDQLERGIHGYSPFRQVCSRCGSGRCRCRLTASKGRYFEADAYDEFADIGDLDFLEGRYVNAMEQIDALEDAVADALGADDLDEMDFLRRLGQAFRAIGGRLGGLARRGLATVRRAIFGPPALPPATLRSPEWTPPSSGQVRTGRVTTPPPSSGSAPTIPDPSRWTGPETLRSPGVPRNPRRFNALDDLLDFVDDEESLDAMAPVIAGLGLRNAMPGVANLSGPLRRQLVHSVANAARQLIRRRGNEAGRAIPKILKSTVRAARQRQLPASALPKAISRTTERVARRLG